MGRRAWMSVVLLSGVSLVSASGCGRLAPAGPPADPDEVALVEKLFPVADKGIPPPSPNAKQEATGTATISGVFRLAAGDPIPARRNLTVEVKKVKNDVRICLPGGKDVYSDALLIDPVSRGISNVLVYMWTKSDRIGWENVSAPPEALALADKLPGGVAAIQVDFDQKACLFLSRVTPIQIGKTLKIINSDPITHNTNVSGVGSPNLPGNTFSLLKPLQEERSPKEVVCNIHNWMKAWLLPRTNGYFAVTKKDGSFEIPNVPTGVKLEFMVWHEKSAIQGGRLFLDVERPDIPNLQWSLKTKGRFRITLEPDTPVDFGDIEVPLSALNP